VGNWKEGVHPTWVVQFESKIRFEGEERGEGAGRHNMDLLDDENVTPHWHNGYSVVGEGEEGIAVGELGVFVNIVEDHVTVDDPSVRVAVDFAVMVV
jgi:hypothetical protein